MITIMKKAEEAKKTCQMTFLSEFKEELNILEEYRVPVFQQESVADHKSSLKRIESIISKNTGAIIIQDNIQEYYDNGWTYDRLLKKSTRFEDMALYELLGSDDVVEKITEKRIVIKKKSGQLHNYEKEYGVHGTNRV